MDFIIWLIVIFRMGSQFSDTAEIYRSTIVPILKRKIMKIIILFVAIIFQNVYTLDTKILKKHFKLMKVNIKKFFLIHLQTTKEGRGVGGVRDLQLPESRS